MTEVFQIYFAADLRKLLYGHYTKSNIKTKNAPLRRRFAASGRRRIELFYGDVGVCAAVGRQGDACAGRA